MKVFSIAFKDLLQQFRNTFAVGMMFIFPLLITGLIYFAFGGVFSSSEGSAGSYSLPVIQVQIVNLDSADAVSGVNAGSMLVDLFKDPALAPMFSVSESSTFEEAAAQVDGQKAAVAVLVPANFTQSVLQGNPVEVTLYQDPTLSFGPGLVKEVVSQFVDSFAGTQITRSVMSEQYQSLGVTLLPQLAAQAQVEYGSYLQSLQSNSGWSIPITIHQPAAKEAANNPMALFMGPVMAGMLIFAVFFTGTNGTISILREQEEGTLARLFTTPTPVGIILGGKFTSIVIMLVVQSVVLLLVSSLAFQINWGGLLPLTMIVVGMVAASAGFGILLISFAKTTRQAGPLVGIGLTFTCMMGGLFTAAVPNLPKAFDLAGMIVPQGWAMRGIKLALNGAGPAEVLLPSVITLVMGIILFAVGARFFSNRFA